MEYWHFRIYFVLNVFMYIINILNFIVLMNIIKYKLNITNMNFSFKKFYLNYLDEVIV